MNRIAGTAFGLLLFMPFESWGHAHAVHHATAERCRPPRPGRRDDPDRRRVPRPLAPRPPRLPRLPPPAGDVRPRPDPGGRGRPAHGAPRRPPAHRGARSSGPTSRWSSSIGTAVILMGWVAVPPRAVGRSPGWRARQASSCSTSSISSRTPTGRATTRWDFADAAIPRQLVPEAARGAALLQRQHRLSPRPPPQRADPELQAAPRPRRDRAVPPGPDAHAAPGPEGPPPQALGRRRPPARRFAATRD